MPEEIGGGIGGGGAVGTAPTGVSGGGVPDVPFKAQPGDFPDGLAAAKGGSFEDFESTIEDGGVYELTPNEDIDFEEFKKGLGLEVDEPLTLESDEPAQEGSGEGSEDAPSEEELTPQERALRKLEAEDPEGYQALMDQMNRDHEFRLQQEKLAQDAEIKKRIEAGDLLADVDPVVAEAWKNEVAPKILAPIFTEVHGMAPLFVKGFENAVIGPIAEALEKSLDSMMDHGVTPTPADAAAMVGQIFQQLVPQLQEALASDMKGITSKFMRASIDSAKISHGATVEGNKSKAVQAELHGQFADKVAGVEKMLGRRLTGEEREEHLTLFGTYLKSFPNMSPVDALEKSFRSLESGVTAGRQSGKAEAQKKAYQQAHRGAHRPGSRAPGVSPMDDINKAITSKKVSLADVEKMAASFGRR